MTQNNGIIKPNSSQKLGAWSLLLRQLSRLESILSRRLLV